MAKSKGVGQGFFKSLTDKGLPKLSKSSKEAIGHGKSWKKASKSVEYWEQVIHDAKLDLKKVNLEIKEKKKVVKRDEWGWKYNADEHTITIPSKFFTESNMPKIANFCILIDLLTERKKLEFCIKQFEDMQKNMESYSTKEGLDQFRTEVDGNLEAKVMALDDTDEHIDKSDDNEEETKKNDKVTA